MSAAVRKRNGSIVHTPNGYRAFVTIGNGSRVSKYFDSEADAASFIEAMRLEVAAERRGDLTVGQWVDKWLSGREAADRIRDTKSDRSRFKTHIEGHDIAEVSLKHVQRKHILTWFDGVQSKVKAQTARNVLSVMRGALAHAHDLGKCKTNPAYGIRVKSAPRSKDAWTTLSIDEIDTFLNLFPAPQKWIIQFAIGTGMRAGELCALERADIHKDRIVIRYGKPPTKKKPTSQPTKSGKPRVIPLFGIARTAWEALSKVKLGPNPHGLAFPLPCGEHRNHAHVLYTHEQWKAKMDVFGRHVRWHDLRHTCASLLVSGGWGRAWTLREVQEFLGHASVTTTERYAHFAGTALTAAAAATEESLINCSKIDPREIQAQRTPLKLVIYQ